MNSSRVMMALSTSRRPVAVRRAGSRSFSSSSFLAPALSGVPAAERNGRWYYLAAMANAGIGNIIQAREQAEQACRMEPGNPEYAAFLNELQRGRTFYTTRSGNFPTVGVGSVCLWLCAANLLCRFCACV